VVEEDLRSARRARRWEERIKRQVEPVDPDLGRDLRQIGRSLRHGGQHQRNHQQPGQNHASKLARRVHAGARDAQDVDPHPQQQDQRDGYMQEHHQGKETSAKAIWRKEVSRDRLAENRKPVQQFGADDGNILRQHVPDQPVAGDARYIDKPDQRHPGEPREPAHATITVIGEFAHQMQQHHRHQKVRSVAVEATRYPGVEPVIVTQPLDRGIGVYHAGVEKDEKVDTGGGDDPEQEPAQRAKLAKGVPFRAEDRIQAALGIIEPAPQAASQSTSHLITPDVARCALQESAGYFAIAGRSPVRTISVKTRQ
jgi:hypothetical protein